MRISREYPGIDTLSPHRRHYLLRHQLPRHYSRQQSVLPIFSQPCIICALRHWSTKHLYLRGRKNQTADKLYHLQPTSTETTPATPASSRLPRSPSRYARMGNESRARERLNVALQIHRKPCKNTTITLPGLTVSMFLRCRARSLKIIDLMPVAWFRIWLQYS